MLRAVIFDFDGVIADSEKLHYLALNEVFKLHGVEVPRAVHWEKYLGFTDVENIEAVSRDYGMGLTPGRVQELMEIKARIFADLVRREDPLIEGVEAFIAMLEQNGIRRAICSGALLIDIREMLANTDLFDRFEVIVTADDVASGKPDPEGYLLALEKLNAAETTPIRPRECVVVEDSHWGLAAAQAAGMRRVAVTNTYAEGELAGKADRVVSRLDALTLADLERLCG